MKDVNWPWNSKVEDPCLKGTLKASEVVKVNVVLLLFMCQGYLWSTWYIVTELVHNVRNKVKEKVEGRCVDEEGFVEHMV